MNPYKYSIGLGLASGLGLCAISAAGYGGWLYYGSLGILFILLMVSTPILKMQPSFKSLMGSVLIICVLAFAGYLAGNWGRRIYSYRICKSCEPIIQPIEEYRHQYGRYPASLPAVTNMATLQEAAGIEVQQAAFKDRGPDPTDLHKADATFYLTNDYYICLVPVTKTLPASLTSFMRLNVYQRECGSQQWTYEEIAWIIGL